MNLVSQQYSTRLQGRHKEALDLFNENKVREAILILADLADEQPANHYICHDLGKAVLAAGMFDQAILAFRQAIELDDTDHESLVMLAKAFELKGDYSDAVVVLNRAVDLLENPGRGEDALEKNANFIPLVFPEQGAVFAVFKQVGNALNLVLTSETRDKMRKFAIRIRISGDVPFEPREGYKEISSGELPRSELLDHLEENVANVVRIFPSETFAYSLLQKNEPDA